MKNFIDQDFLLESELSKRLYFDVAKDLPIVDYHCHLDATEILENKNFSTISDLWLKHDHYKWRLMRTAGIDEDFITGSAAPGDKYEAFVKTLNLCPGNPVYYWSLMELSQYFGLETIPQESDNSYEFLNKQLASPEFTPQALLEQRGVRLVCTTDDPSDDLAAHKRFAHRTIQLMPGFRPDNIYIFNNNYYSYIQRLALSANQKINNIEDLCAAVKVRHDYFHENGCRVADFGADFLVSETLSEKEADRIFKKMLKGKAPSEKELYGFKNFIILFVAKLNHSRGWYQQFHLGVIRNINPTLFRCYGRDAGGDSVGGFSHCNGLSFVLGQLEQSGALARTALYNANPADSVMFASLAQSFQGGGIKGKMQYGPAWWFLDNFSGISDHLEIIASQSSLFTFAGMVTDSRSLLSYSRHDYFRRILCNFIAKKVDAGVFPEDFDYLSKLVQAISYKNSYEYLGLKFEK
ncbi:MAG: glucuronate isomerase [Spirochaetales bacterium]|nr:glucuronate isomerase [Spirochaetales bacterium]